MKGANPPKMVAAKRTTPDKPLVHCGFFNVDSITKGDVAEMWAKLDPAMKTTYAGPVAAPGSSYSWSGNDKVGEGRMTIVEAKPGERLRLHLEFLKPFASTSSTEFSFTPKAGGTETAWTMEGHNNFLGKAFSVFMDMDKMIGNDFQKGLSQLKAVADELRAETIDAV